VEHIAPAVVHIEVDLGPTSYLDSLVHHMVQQMVQVLLLVKQDLY